MPVQAELVVRIHQFEDQMQLLPVDNPILVLVGLFEQFGDFDQILLMLLEEEQQNRLLDQLEWYLIRIYLESSSNSASETKF